MDERELIRKSQAGDLRAFELLVHRRRNQIFRIARQILGDDEEAKDVAQLVFIRLWQSLGRYREEGSFGAYLHRITVNLALDSARREGSPDRAERMDPEGLEEAGARTEHPDSRIEPGEIQRIFQILSRRLSPRQKAAFVLREIRGNEHGGSCGDPGNDPLHRPEPRARGEENPAGRTRQTVPRVRAGGRQKAGMREHREGEHPEDAAAGPDPTFFFKPLARENPPEEFWTGFWPSIRAGIRESRDPLRGLLTRRRAVLLGSSAGLMAAAAILVVAFLVIPAMRIPETHGTTGRETASSDATRSPAEPPSPPILEDLQSASARVYTFHVGESADSTDVILIVDESLDI